MPGFNKKSDGSIFGDLLRDVSRSFYLTLTVLPIPIRVPIGIAYLIARAADTIVDTDIIATQQRLEILNQLRLVVSGEMAVKALLKEIKAVVQEQQHQGERILLERLDGVFFQLSQLSDYDREQVQAVVMTLTNGMLLDLQTFPPEDSNNIIALPTAQALDHYTYLVAGCVGEFWSNICFAHDSRLAKWNLANQKIAGIQFGKALQLTNILRDIADDLRIGRCYLPSEQLEALQLSPEALLDASIASKLNPLYCHWIKQALIHYEAAEQYIINTPRRCLLLRLATLWPVLIGLRTLCLIASNDDYLNPNSRTKVKRFEVYRLISGSLFIVGSNVVLKSWLKKLRNDVTERLS